MLISVAEMQHSGEGYEDLLRPNLQATLLFKDPNRDLWEGAK